MGAKETGASAAAGGSGSRVLADLEGRKTGAASRTGVIAGGIAVGVLAAGAGFAAWQYQDANGAVSATVSGPAPMQVASVAPAAEAPPALDPAPETARVITEPQAMEPPAAGTSPLAALAVPAAVAATAAVGSASASLAADRAASTPATATAKAAPAAEKAATKSAARKTPAKTASKNARRTAAAPAAKPAPDPDADLIAALLQRRVPPAPKPNP